MARQVAHQGPGDRVPEHVRRPGYVRDVGGGPAPRWPCRRPCPGPCARPCSLPGGRRGPDRVDAVRALVAGRARPPLASPGACTAVVTNTSARDHGDAGQRAAAREDHAATGSGAAGPDRSLDQDVGERGQREGDQAASEEQRLSLSAGAVGVHDDEHRPVPQVDAVGDSAEQDQGRQSQQPRGPAARHQHHVREQHGDRHREGGQPAAVQPAVAAVRMGPGPREAQRPRRRPADRAPRALVGSGVRAGVVRPVPRQDAPRGRRR